jgi:predicted nucleotide-binding protein (sugar kinase/HSP70/actin superfamily)
MAPMQFRFLEAAFRAHGYRLEILPSTGPADVDEGLRHVNNDACYPSILVVGQLVAALKSGRYDLARTSVIITQTGGGCRATNYIGFIRKALRDAGYAHVPVVSLNLMGMERHPGFKVTLGLFRSMVAAVLYGDLLMKCVLRTRPYEAVEGAADALCERWAAICAGGFARGAAGGGLGGALGRFARDAAGIVRDFDALPLRECPRKPRVGLVGEILVKFHPGANTDAVALVVREGG